MKTFIYKVDHFVANLFHELCVWGGDISNSVMNGISLIAEAGILFLLVGLGLALFKRTRKIGGTILLSVALGFVFTNVILKNIISRSRPFQNIGSDYYKWWLNAGSVNETGFSFPSGHTTATTAFAVAIFLNTKKQYGWPILLFPLLMASSRIYLMVHFFSDCVGALVVGTISALLAYLIANLIYKSHLKFFVWIREFNVFRPKQKITYSKKPEVNQPENNDYVYETQASEKEKEESTRLIEKEIKEKTNNAEDE